MATLNLEKLIYLYNDKINLTFDQILQYPIEDILMNFLIPTRNNDNVILSFLIHIPDDKFKEGTHCMYEIVCK